MTSDWGYGQTDGPHTWALNFPWAAGHRQSPVDIQTSEVVFDQDLSSASASLKIDYLPQKEVRLVNTGSSFKVNILHDAGIEGGPLNHRYKLEQFHLHWGSDNSRGSEHTLNGHPFAAELHLVHWNCDNYTSFAEAADKDDGLAVLAVMIEFVYVSTIFTEERAHYPDILTVRAVPGEEHGGFRMLTEGMANVPNKSDQLSVATFFQPTCLLPDNTHDYWTYRGSLTTPPCFESVQWIVFSEPIRLSFQQLECLRRLKDSETDGNCIQDNYRPPLPLGGRKIRSSFLHSL